MGFLTGKTALITGAGRAVLQDGSCGSIGYGIATAYAKEGANLVITGRNVKKLEEAKQELESKYGIKVLPVQADVCAGGDNEATVQNVVKQAVDAFGGIQVLINNAQASASGVSLAEHTTEQFDLALYSGLYAAFYYMKACYPYLKESHGSVINFASGAGLFGNYGQCAYAAAKEGIRGLSRVAATEWGPDDINVNVVCPLAWTAKLEQFQQAYPEAQGQRQNAAHGPLRQRRTGDRTRVRPAGHAGLQVHVRRDPHAGRRHGSAPVTLRFSSFFSIDKRGCAGGHSLFCLSVAFGISPAPRCTRSRALHPWGWLPPARSCGPGTALQRPWHTLRSQPQSR